MPLTCLLNVPLVLIWMSKPSLPVISKEHSSRDPFPVQEFLFLFIEQPLILLFPRSALFRLFLLLFPAFLFLPPFVCLTGLHQGGGVKSESLEHADGDQPDKGSSFRAPEAYPRSSSCNRRRFVPAVSPLRNRREYCPLEK